MNVTKPKAYSCEHCCQDSCRACRTQIGLENAHPGTKRTYIWEPPLGNAPTSELENAPPKTVRGGCVFKDHNAIGTGIVYCGTFNHVEISVGIDNAPTVRKRTHTWELLLETHPLVTLKTHILLFLTQYGYIESSPVFDGWPFRKYTIGMPVWDTAISRQKSSGSCARNEMRAVGATLVVCTCIFRLSEIKLPLLQT